MHRSPRYTIARRWAGLIILFCLPALMWLVYPAQTADITVNRITAKWILDVLFENGGITATRTNQLYNKGALALEWTEPMSCVPVGTVTLGPDRAIFAGGYIRCDLTSFKEAVFTYTNGQIVLANSCSNGGKNVRVYGIAVLNNVDFTVSVTQPLINHPDFQATFTLLEAQGTTDGQLRLEAGPMTTNSAPFSLPSAEAVVASRLAQCNGLQCRGQHALNGALLTKEAVPQGAPWNSTSGPTTVYIGADGALRFYGEMLEGIWDPGCIVREG